MHELFRKGYTMTKVEDQRHTPITPSFVARYCQVSKSTVLQWVKDGKLKAFALPSGHYRIDKEGFRDFLDRYNMPIEDWLVESEFEKRR